MTVMRDRELEESIKRIIMGFDEAILKNFIKQERKLWKDIKIPLTLEGFLNQLTKDEMTTIRQNFKLRGLSSLKKNELADKLKDLIPLKINTVLDVLDDERYRILKKILNQGGYIKVKDFDYKKAKFFREFGLVFTGKLNGEKVLVMPMEIMNVFKEYDTKEYRKLVKRNTLWIDLVAGMLFYYGFLYNSIIIKKVEEYTGKKPNVVDLSMVLLSASQYYEKLKLTAKGYKNPAVHDENWVVKEQNTRVDTPYYPFSKLELLKASKDNYIRRTAQTNNFSEYLKLLYDISDEEIDDILRAVHDMINYDFNIEEMINYLKNFLEIEDIEVFQMIGQLLIDINNNTRMWILKGYTPIELINYKENLKSNNTNIIDINTKKKIGRNDPCPCGSGKKYKKCCGR
jgi:hypothetical protein